VSSRRTRFAVALVFIITAALVFEPLPERDFSGLARADSLDLSSPFRAIGSLFAGIPQFVGSLFSTSEVHAAPAPTKSASPPRGRVCQISCVSGDHLYRFGLILSP
jgi:hypothetical protein